MRYNTFINNVKAIEWGLNANQAALFDLLNQIQSWAKAIVIGNDVYYHISRNKVIEEIPLFYSKPDTVYRHFIVLEQKGLIQYMKIKKKDMIRLTELGKSWNSEMNPNLEDNPEKLGNESEKNSEMNPTYNNTILDNNTIDKRQIEFKDEVYRIGSEQLAQLPKSELDKFIDYWTEPNKSKSKMKFELQQTWDTFRRLKTWGRNFFGDEKTTTDKPTIFKMK